MRLPETIRVKLSSEEAGAISMTPVLSREMPLRELVELMLDFTGKDPLRVHELLLRGSLVIGASRYRWTGWDADLEDLTEMLGVLPSPQPERLFDPDHCVRLILHGPALRLEIAKQSFCERRFLRSRSFWDALMEIAAERELAYAGYSYRERADRYRLEITACLASRLASSASLLRYSRLGEHFRNGMVERIEFLVERSAA
ncbi:MAG: hypothetical protein ACUVXB_03445 [Bryobacteraceae bacterium]